ncbi:MAG: hypothetical protein CML50_02690 [Rhodobacteraceae bacterium]|nr:hypothetical protein [Paracoccaceae bacterium]
MSLLPRAFTALVLLLATLLVAGCATPPPHELPRPSDGDIAELAREITALGPDIDPAEARRAAQIAYDYPLRLAVRYEIEDPPYIHNIKVNQGIKPRGLCYQWADDLEARLRQEGFTTLELQRAIANSENAFRIEHSTVVVTAPGDSMYDGIVLDPWRYGGELYWGAVTEDHKYPWLPRQEVFKRKRLRAGGMAAAR